MTTKDYCSINFTGLTHDHTLECRGEVAAAAAAASSTATDGDENGQTDAYCSAIPILKQHPMYDCLVLVRKFRNCLGGYSLEFPVDKIREHERLPTNESAHQHPIGANDGLDDHDYPPHTSELNTDDNGATQQQQQQGESARARSACSQRRLVSRFLDGDDPVYRGCTHNAGSLTSSLSQTSMGNCEQHGLNNAEEITPTGAGAGAGTQTDETDARLLFMAQIDDRGDQCHLVHVPINGLLDRLESYTRNGVAVDSRVYAFAMGLKTAERMITNKSMKELHETPI